MKMIQIENKHIKEKEPKRKSSRKIFAPKKVDPHQMKMNSVTVRQKEFYSWQQNTLINKTLKKNMKRHNLTTEKNC